MSSQCLWQSIASRVGGRGAPAPVHLPRSPGWRFSANRLLQSPRICCKQSGPPHFQTRRSTSAPALAHITSTPTPDPAGFLVLTHKRLSGGLGRPPLVVFQSLTQTFQKSWDFRTLHPRPPLRDILPDELKLFPPRQSEVVAAMCLQSLPGLSICPGSLNFRISLDLAARRCGLGLGG